MIKPIAIPVITRRILLCLVMTVSLFIGIVTPVYAGSICADNMSALDCQAIVNGWQNWVPDSGNSACGASGSTTLTGSDTIQKIYNYLVAQGITPIAAAGIMGNMQAESHFDPSIEQTPGAWEDMSSLNINQGGKGGVGLVQWDGGRRPNVITYMKGLGLTDADFHIASDKLLSAELGYVMHELQTDYKDSTFTPIQAATDPGNAAFIFHKGYEGSSDGPDKIKGRMDNAVSIYGTYGGGAATVGSTTTTTTPTNCASTSPDCTNVSGVAKILCAAKAYDTVSYSESIAGGHLPGGAVAWHSTCPIVGPSCVLDCSGLVNIAVYDAFGANLSENTDGQRADIGKYWKIVSLAQVQSGDIVQPNPGHVEIIDHVQGGTIYAFAAQTDGVPQPQQVGPQQESTSNSNNLYLHYIGPGV